MIRTMFYSTISLPALLTAMSCMEQAVQPEGSVALEALAFQKPVFQVGEPIIIVATISDSASVLDDGVSVRVIHGAVMELDLNPWAGLTDSELYVLVAAAGGRVFIGFESGDGIAANMIAELRDAGVVITSEFHRIAAVAAVMPDDFNVLVRFRNDENVTYIEPIFPSTIAVGPAPPRPDLIGVISAEQSNSLRWHSGTQLTVLYTQPNGMRLEASTRIQ